VNHLRHTKFIALRDDKKSNDSTLSSKAIQRYVEIYSQAWYGACAHRETPYNTLGPVLKSIWSSCEPAYK
jgi:hypothetical protein